MIGRVIGGAYSIKSRLGAGSMGEVYLAQNGTTFEQVAVKVMRDRGGDRFEALQRFFREAQAGALLSHERCVKVLAQGQDAGLAYIAMEYVQGESLKTMLEFSGALAPERAC